MPLLTVAHPKLLAGYVYQGSCLGSLNGSYVHVGSTLQYLRDDMDPERWLKLNSGFFSNIISSNQVINNYSD